MPFGAITLRPGVNTVFTPTLNQAGISDSNLIRFRMGLVEKMGGWQKFITTATGAVISDLHAWQDLQQNKWLAAAGQAYVAAINNSAVTEITPYTSTFNPAVNVSTTAGSKSVTIVDANITGSITTFDSVYFNTPITIGGITLTGLYPISNGGTGTYQIRVSRPALTTVANAGAVPSFSVTSGNIICTVTFADHNLSVGGEFNFPIPTVVGGVTISGPYVVRTVPTTSTFTIALGSVATATASASMNAGLAQYLYFLTQDPSGISSRTGPPGALGQFELGEEASSIISVSSQAGNTPVTGSQWTSDNWGEIYLCCPKGGGIYYWSPGSGFGTATLIGTAPPLNGGIFVSMPQQILVAWGSTVGTNSSIGGGSLRQDPLIVRWSDVLDFTNWTVSSATSAGSFHISTGSEIRGGMQGATQALIWTDIDVWAMQFIGYPLVFGFNALGYGCGLIGPHGAIDLRGTTYWWNEANFYILDQGGVRPLPCPLWDDVFQDLDLTNKSKCVAAANSAFNEVFFFYPSTSGGTGECDKYVKLNVVENAWDKGSLPRSAWIEQSVLGPPIGSDPTTLLLQQHETGYNDDGSAMNSFYETGYAAVGDGEEIVFVDHFEPDAKWMTFNSTTSAQLSVTISGQIYPNDAVTVNPTVTMNSSTAYLAPRIRGRQLKWRVESNDLDSWWRMGLVRYRYGIDGRR